MTAPRDNHSVISSLLNSLMSSPKLKKAAGVFVAAFVGAIAVNGFTGNGITNAFRHATQETMKSVKGGAGAPAALPGQNPTATGSTAGLPDSTANAGAQEVQGQVVKVADGDTIRSKKRMARRSASGSLGSTPRSMTRRAVPRARLISSRLLPVGTSRSAIGTSISTDARSARCWWTGRISI